MQKKTNPQDSSSTNWQDNFKKQAKQDQMKKFGIWGAIIIASIAGLAALVILAGKTGPSTTPVEKANLPKVTSKDIIVGDPKSKITLTEYGDLQCPACASYNPVVNKVLADYKGKVRLVFRFFPLRSVHQNAVISGQAAYAATKQGTFAEMKDILFEKQTDWEHLPDPREVFISYATTLGMDGAKFQTDMNSDEAKNTVLAGETESLGLGLNSTPSFFLGNSYFTPSGYDGFKSLIDEELKK